MKIRNLLSAFLMCAVATSFAQEIEYDDMYFNSKDREKLNSLKATQAYAYSDNTRKTEEEASYENPTDSYSARNINPEYISRSNARSIQEDEDYFVNNYQYRSKNYYDNWDRSYSNWASSSWYNNGWYSPGFNTWNSPYYGYSSWGMHGPFYAGYYDPFYPSYAYGAWPNSYYYGSSWGYGWGAGLSWGNPYYSNNFWGPSWSSWGRGYYYPGTIVIVDDNTNNRNVTYGRRASRGGNMVLPNNQTRNRSELPSYDNRGRNENGRVSTSQGRVSTATSTRGNATRQEEYYDRSWRRSSQESTPTRSSSTYNNNNSYNNSSWGNSNSNSGTRTRSSSSWSNGNSGGNNYNYNRSSSGGGSTPSYTPSRSSSGSSGSSGTNGRTRRD